MTTSEFLRYASVLAHELPRRLRQALVDFKLQESDCGVCVISGYTIDQHKLGPTPEHWNRVSGFPACDEEAVLILCGSILGDLFGWATQQNGRILHDVLPIKGCEREQLGSSSEELLWWHTEDAFHPFRGDYLGLMCLRNPDNVATTVAGFEPSALSDEHRRVLTQPRFTIRPDESHLKKNRSESSPTYGDVANLEQSYRDIEQMHHNPDRIPVIFGGLSYVRVDPYFMDLQSLDVEARDALESLIAGFEERLVELRLQPGDICFIDNYRAVHGRQPFKARYDGNDRWLKRINITRDLRRSREVRADVDARIIG